MWLTAPLGHEVAEALGRLQRAPDVQRIAVMPDVHLANEICVGVVLATSRLIYPQAVGGDIGCGMLAVATDSTGGLLHDPKAGDLGAKPRSIQSKPFHSFRDGTTSRNGDVC